MLFVLTCGDGRGHVSPLAMPKRLTSFLPSTDRQRTDALKNSDGLCENARQSCASPVLSIFDEGLLESARSVALIDIVSMINIAAAALSAIAQASA